MGRDVKYSTALRDGSVLMRKVGEIWLKGWRPVHTFSSNRDNEKAGHLLAPEHPSSQAQRTYFAHF